MVNVKDSRPPSIHGAGQDCDAMLMAAGSHVAFPEKMSPVWTIPRLPVQRPENAIDTGTPPRAGIAEEASPRSARTILRVVSNIGGFITFRRRPSVGLPHLLSRLPQHAPAGLARRPACRSLPMLAILAVVGVAVLACDSHEPSAAYLSAQFERQRPSFEQLRVLFDSDVKAVGLREVSVTTDQSAWCGEGSGGRCLSADRWNVYATDLPPLIRYAA